MAIIQNTAYHLYINFYILYVPVGSALLWLTAIIWCAYRELRFFSIFAHTAQPNGFFSSSSIQVLYDQNVRTYVSCLRMLVSVNMFAFAPETYNRKAATTDTVSEIWIHSPVWSFVCIYVMFLHYQNAQHWHCTLKIGLKEFFFVSIFGLWLSVDFCTMALRTQASGTMPTKNTYWTIYE